MHQFLSRCTKEERMLWQEDRKKAGKWDFAAIRWRRVPVSGRTGYSWGVAFQTMQSTILWYCCSEWIYLGAVVGGVTAKHWCCGGTCRRDNILVPVVFFSPSDGHYFSWICKITGIVNEQTAIPLNFKLILKYCSRCQTHTVLVLLAFGETVIFV